MICNCCVAKEETILVWKNIHCMFTYESVEMLHVCVCVCVWERERKREREIKDVNSGLTEDCYIWHHIFLTQAVTLYSEPHPVLSWQGWSGPFLNARPLDRPRAVPSAAFALTTRFSEQTANLVKIETVCLYNILRAYTFLFWFPTHTNLFCRPAFPTGASSKQNLLLTDLWICNTIKKFKKIYKKAYICFLCLMTFQYLWVI